MYPIGRERVKAEDQARPWLGTDEARCVQCKYALRNPHVWGQFIQYASV